VSLWIVLSWLEHLLEAIDQIHALLALPQGKKFAVSTEQKAGCIRVSQSRSGHRGKGKFLTLPGIDLRPLSRSPVASSYTDCAILAPRSKDRF
jgi:hypothetical protein